MSTDEIQEDESWLKEQVAHIEKHIGPIANVFQEAESNTVRLDIFIVAPQPHRDFYTLLTCGMSERAMKVPLFNPEDIALIPELKFAELMLCLPPDWPLTPDTFSDESNYWPIRWLKRIARLPHIYDSHLGLGHTIPNGDPPKPFANNTQFVCWTVDEPVLSAKEFVKLRGKDKIVNYYSIVPMYLEEMEFKLREGTAILNKRWDDEKVNELIDVNRKNTSKS